MNIIVSECAVDEWNETINNNILKGRRTLSRTGANC